MKQFLSVLMMIFIGCNAPGPQQTGVIVASDTIPDTTTDVIYPVAANQVDTMQPAPVADITIETKTVFHKTKNKRYTLTIKYPVIKGLSDKTIENKINRKLKKAFVDDNYIKEKLEEQEDDDQCHLNEQIDFTTEFLSRDYFSFEYNHDECPDDCYGSGPCHGSEYYNYNLNTAAPYKLTDLLIGDYRSVFIKGLESHSDILEVKPEILEASTDDINQLPFYTKKNEDGSYSIELMVTYDRWTDAVTVSLDNNLKLINPQGPLRFMLNK